MNLHEAEIHFQVRVRIRRGRVVGHHRITETGRNGLRLVAFTGCGGVASDQHNLWAAHGGRGDIGQRTVVVAVRRIRIARVRAVLAAGKASQSRAGPVNFDEVFARGQSWEQVLAVVIRRFRHQQRCSVFGVQLDCYTCNSGFTAVEYRVVVVGSGTVVVEDQVADA